MEVSGVFGQVVGSVVPIVRLPMTVVQGIEALVEQLSTVATRAGQVLDQIEGMPSRVEGVLDRIEPVIGKAEGVVRKADALPKRFDKLLDRAEGLPEQIEDLITRANTISDHVASVVADAGLTLAQLQPAVKAIADLDPTMIASLIEGGAELLPALRTIELLVPAVGHLEEQVDHLDRTVADVGALLGGIPGAGRLLKRGETRPVRDRRDAD